MVYPKKVRVFFLFDASRHTGPSTGSFRAGPNEWGRLFEVSCKIDVGPGREVNVRRRA
jgi:hypothetical protein